MKLNWLPWKLLLKYAVRTYDIIDPVKVLGRLRRFAQPSEIQEPIELLRAGIVFHARGLINSKAIQYNLDWVWPYWVVKQFDPTDTSFIPRAFSFSHVNLTHRNWTAVGVPGLSVYPLVDPRGLITPLFDGWSIDFWLISKDENFLFPSALPDARQSLDMTRRLKIKSSFQKNGFALETTVWLDDCGKTPEVIAAAAGCLKGAGWLVVALRPYNPEGIQFIDRIDWSKADRTLLVNAENRVLLAQAPEKVLFSNYRAGDVARRYRESETAAAIRCSIGMATAAAFFPLEPGIQREIEVRVPLSGKQPLASGRLEVSECGWDSMLSRTARLTVPAEEIQFLYDSAVRTLILLTAGEAVPGPYTYRRFWFRDACFMINALLALGLAERAGRLIRAFSARQKRSGYFQSQEGEWDSNGQVLWIADRFQQLTGRCFDSNQTASLLKGAEWIQKKRISKNKSLPHSGLLPAGFSAEHLGPNDFYYWDDFWGVAGLRAAGRIADRLGFTGRRYKYERDALDLETCIFKSIARAPQQKKHGGVPASPYRRMDAGAVGSLVADYPLQITGPGNLLIMKTAEFLMEHCFQSGAFFQDMIHSGINPYLTLAIAQTLLRGGDRRYREMIEAVADLASPTGQWPEAIHPITKGGCMGDGQHGWAAAEWIMIIRNLLIREEKAKIVIGSGIFPEWLRTVQKVAFGPTLTAAGRISITLTPAGAELLVDIESDAKDPSLPLEISVPGYRKKEVSNSSGRHILEK